MSQATKPSVTLGHIVVVAPQAWGHTRPLCGLVSRIVKTRQVSITLFTTRPSYDRIKTEISRNFDAHESSTRAQIRLIALPSNEQNPADFKSSEVSFAKAYGELVEERTLTCVVTSEEFPALPSPNVAIFDFFANAMMEIVRQHDRKPVKVYSWVSSSAIGLHFHWGPSSRNKNGDAHLVAQREAERSGKPIQEVAEEFFCPAKGNVIQVPGMPPMYDYEQFPQETILKNVPIGMFRMHGAEVANECDGMIIGTSQCYEPSETLEDLSRWFAKTSRQVHVFGPMFPVYSSANISEKEQVAKAQGLDDFIARILESHGPKSLLYISFGTIWWPTEPAKIWTFLDVLLERNVPFILSHSSPFASKIPDDVREKVEASGLGLLLSWAPQQYILAHAVTGWFVTHCGFNSVVESISCGIPMICWPFHADQPLNAVHLTDNLKIAYELLEVRSGHGLKPICRTSVAPRGTADAIREETNHILDQAFGEDGREKRANVEKLKGSLSHVWTEQGSSQLALERFLDTLFS